MATLTIQVVSGLGTSTKTLTFSAGDASRILSAWQAKVQPGGTQDQFAAWLSMQAQRLIASVVADSETATPAPPTMT